jgi:hypothetical protein
MRPQSSGVLPGGFGSFPVFTLPSALTPPGGLVSVLAPVVKLLPFLASSLLFFSELPGVGTFGAVTLGELCCGAGVGEPKLSYCCCAETMLPLTRTVAAAKATESVFMSSFL